MGYSMSFPCKDAVSCEEMLSFLERNFKQPDKLLPESGIMYLGGDLITWVSEENLTYSNIPNSIGFNVNRDISEPFSNYVESVLAWAVDRVGKPLVFDGMPYPYMEYDGSEKWLFMLSDCDADASFSGEYDESVTGQIYINDNGAVPFDKHSILFTWVV